MEAAHTFNERTPLLGRGAAANGPGQVSETYVKEQTLLEGKETVFNEQAPLVGGRVISNDQAAMDEIGVISNDQAAMDGIDVISNDQAAMDGIGVISNDQATMDEIGVIFTVQTPLDGNGVISNEQATPFGERTSSNLDKNPLTTSPRNFERRTNEVSLEEVVQALCSAWQRNSRSRDEVTVHFFTTKELYAMHLAWKNVTLGRHCSSPPYIIAESVATAIVKERHPRFKRDGNELNACEHLHFYVEENLIAANFLGEWFDIDSKGKCFPARYIETIFEDSDEQPVAVSEFWLRQVDRYDRVHDFILNPKLQILLHCLMFIWHISIIIIGSKNMDCPMGHQLSHLLMILGCFGCLAILVRLALMILKSNDEHPYYLFWKWKGLRLIEFTFFIVFIIQAFHFFSIDTTTERDPNQCTEKFYSEALVLNYVSIALVSAYVFVYSIIFCGNQFDIWHWIITYFKV